MVWGLVIGVIVGLVGWYTMGNEGSKNLVGSLFAGMIGALFGKDLFEGMGLRGGIYSLVFALLIACILVFLINLMIRAANNS
ncbi:hypothetical protein [Saccharibacillus brassicae]|uniref:GlsB/YeaQ/YmgE family stress response membrane protein n=1 Tax=Saccharibacillus brassicae TaxID=2583377 RepID=A0A4Y6UYK7_SACBS|nr:hypothetical protein [Saccharibacillus brassicae]QDH21608.1 hypothetical protein FFV09_12600 [Saccharibacillus brassicae]